MKKYLQVSVLNLSMGLEKAKIGVSTGVLSLGKHYDDGHLFFFFFFLNGASSTIQNELLGCMCELYGEDM